MDEAFRAFLQDVANELSGRGAHAVVLVGSHARGDAHARSDIDLYAIGSGPEYHLERRGGHLLAISWRTRDAVRDSFSAVAEAGVSVPAWRDAILLLDRGAVASALQMEAVAWRWEDLGDAPDRWVAAEVTGYAEEVQKLHAALDGDIAGDGAGPALVGVQRSVLATRMAGILAVHRRLLYESENVLWDRVAELIGDGWRRVQSAALALEGESLQQSAAAALQLYAMAAGEVRSLLDERQLAVVRHATALAGHPLDGETAP